MWIASLKKAWANKARRKNVWLTHTDDKLHTREVSPKTHQKIRLFWTYLSMQESAIHSIPGGRTNKKVHAKKYGLNGPVFPAYIAFPIRDFPPSHLQYNYQVLAKSEENTWAKRPHHETRLSNESSCLISQQIYTT